ncbi:MAG: transcription antitermination factor NusB [Candidatus Eisenbacteria bacterium]|nr:transcription antitermination factor NusB [Candidatus Eisenbacteria bacterium]
MGSRASRDRDGAPAERDPAGEPRRVRYPVSIQGDAATQDVQAPQDDAPRQDAGATYDACPPQDDRPARREARPALGGEGVHQSGELPARRRAGRPKARDVVMRILYESSISGDDPLEILELVFGRFRFTEDGRAYAARLIEAFRAHRDQIDAVIAARLEHWDLRRLGAIERAILRLAATELLHLPDTPARVVLDEALRLAHRYGSERSASFVNGVCDPIARDTRARELEARTPHEGRA